MPSNILKYINGEITVTQGADMVPKKNFLLETL